MNRSRLSTSPVAILGVLAILLGGLVALAAPATAAPNDVKINEVRSDPTDTIELVNTGAGTVDISGWTLKDDDDTHSWVLPSSTTIPAGGHLSIDVTAFGLGKGESARL